MPRTLPRRTRAVTLAPKAALKTEVTRRLPRRGRAGIVDRRAVKAGGIDGDRAQVLAGLRAGERVVVSPPANLVSGACRDFKKCVKAPAAATL